MLDKVKLILGMDDSISSKDNLIKYLINITQQKVLQYCNFIVLPDELESIVVEIVIMRYNKLGSEGIKSESEGKRQVEYTEGIEDIPEDFKPLLNKFRKVKW